MTESWYHMAVIGSDLAGLLMAALAAKSGYRVLVLGQGDRPNQYKYKNFPFVIKNRHLTGFQSSPIVQHIFSELGIHPALQSTENTSDLVQIASPRMRLDLLKSQAGFLRECTREIPESLETLLALDRDFLSQMKASQAFLAPEDKSLLPEGKAPPFTESPALERLQKEGRGQHIFSALMAHLSDLHTGPLFASPIASPRIWTHLRSGMRSLESHSDHLKAQLIRKIREQSSDVRLDVTVKTLHSRRGKVSALSLSRGNESIACEFLLLNTDSHRAMALLGENPLTTKALPPTRAWKMNINLGITKHAVPKSMAPNLLWLDDESLPFRYDNSLWLSYSLQDGLPQALHLEAFCESALAVPSQAQLEQTKDRALASLTRLLPWLPQHVKLIQVPALEPPNKQNELYLQALSPIYARSVKGSHDLNAIPHSLAYKNVYLGNDECNAALGFEGQCLTALHAHQHLKTVMPLRRPFQSF